jgi:L-ascorbate metabolism protein UlaG (beta-lactamase superfamily)
LPANQATRQSVRRMVNPLYAVSRNLGIALPYFRSRQQHQPRLWLKDEVTASWLGHATVLINFFGATILTDPVLGKRIGVNLGKLKLGARRITEFPLQPEEMPPVDIVLLSHAHHDHWDMSSLKKFGHATDVIYPAGNSDLVPKRSFRRSIGLDWQESRRVRYVRFSAFEAKHFGRRMPRARQRGHNAYVMSRQGVKILFGGDTAYIKNFADYVGNPFDICIFGIGCYNPNVRSHATPEQVWDMFKQVKGRWLLPIHWRTFLMTREPVMEPMERLLKAAGDEADKIVCKIPGEVFVLPRAGKAGRSVE